MKQFIYKSLILGSALIAASCSNSAYEFDQLFPQEYHKDSLREIQRQAGNEYEYGGDDSRIQHQCD